MKKIRLKLKNIIFTTLAKGGAPSGQIWPSNTIKFNTISTTIPIFKEDFFIVFFFILIIQINDWDVFAYSIEILKLQSALLQYTVLSFVLNPINLYFFFI